MKLNKFIIPFVWFLCIFCEVFPAYSVKPWSENKVRYMIVASDNNTLSEQDFKEMFNYSEEVLGLYETATKDIIKLRTLEDRKEAADKFNYDNKDLYNCYGIICRIIGRAYKSECLPPKMRKRTERLGERDAYVNRMFTKFRSRQEL